MRTIVAASIAMALVGVMASPAAGQVTQDSVTGVFTTGNTRGDFVFTFDVHSGPSGENPVGSVGVLYLGAGDLGTFAASCLAVSGSRATVVVPFPFDPPAPAGMVIHIEDNGTVGDGVGWSLVSDLPTTCHPPDEVPANEEGTGDVTVVDAQPFPTSKGQCKSGGWRTFGIFKSQGDCVSFVVTKGKNPPA